MVLTLGILLVVVLLIDVIWTTMWVGGGAGPVTRAVGDLAWKAIKVVGRGRHAVMPLAGPVILTLTVITWLLLLWSGWFMVFSAEATSVLTSATDEIADTSDRIYFAGYTVFTLGNGDFVPNGDCWQIATALASGSGLFTATLSLTYLISVVSAAVSARSFASEVDGLGSSPASIVSDGWDGSRYGDLALPLQSLASQLTKLSQQYLAYPVLQYFHAGDAAKSPMVALVRLDQILAVSAHGVPADSRAPAVMHNSVRSAIENVLESLPKRFVQPAEDGLPTPDLDPLRHAGRPALRNEEFTHLLQPEERRRRKLRGLLNAHGWSLSEI